VIFAVSLQGMMGLGGLVSFGHAAFFGIGALAAAWLHLQWQASLLGACLGAVLCCVVMAALVGGVIVRSSGVYMAMLSLALAQVVWAGATQWNSVTGGDNGLIGLQLVMPSQQPVFFMLLVTLAMLAIFMLRRFSRSALGLALQAARDAAQRSIASGLPIHAMRYRVYVGSAGVAGLAGGLFAAQKGAVFPSVASVPTSVDVLLVLLLGGVHQLWGSLVGAGILSLASSELGRDFDYWRGALGLLIMLIMVLAPSGLLGLRDRSQHGA